MAQILDSEALPEFFIKAGLRLLELPGHSFEQIGSTVRSYLTALFEQGLVTYEVSANRMLWHVAEKGF